MSTATILEQKGYSLSDILNRYRREKGDCPLIIAQLSYQELSELFHDYVKIHLAGNKSKLTVSEWQKNLKFKPTGYSDQISFTSLMLAFHHAALKLDGFTDDIKDPKMHYKRPNYSKSALLARWRAENP